MCVRGERRFSRKGLENFMVEVIFHVNVSRPVSVYMKVTLPLQCHNCHTITHVTLCYTTLHMIVTPCYTSCYAVMARQEMMTRTLCLRSL